MADTAPLYELPPADDELDTLVNIKVVADEDTAQPPVGAVVEATVLTADDTELTLSAAGVTVVVPIDDAKAADGTLPAAKDAVRVLVESAEDDGPRRGSIHKAAQLDRYAELVRLSQRTEPIQATILVPLRRGFSVDIDGFRGFLANEASGISREQAFDAVGSSVDVEIRELDPKSLELVVSRERFVEEARSAAFKEVTSKLNITDIVEGTVTSTTRFGAFVDVQGVEGLVHLSEMGIDRVDANKLPLSVGDRVTVQVVQIDDARQRLGLSRREVLLEEQRAKIEALPLQSIVEGRVDALTDFGAFIEFGDGLRGLCHISELSWTERVADPKDVLRVGEAHAFRVIKVDPVEGRVSLSLRQATDNPWSRFVDTTPVGSQLDVVIQSVEDRGLVVAVNDDMQGFIRLSDLSWTIRAEHPSDVREFTVGETLPATLLLVEPQRQRILLGLKQIEEDPWDLAGDVTTVGHVFKASVDRFTETAAFLTVGPGLDARMHVSEISTERVESIRAALRIGEEVEVMTIQADRARRRLDVSIKAIEAKRLAEQPRAYAEDARMGGLADALRDSGLVTKSDDRTEPEANANTASEGSAEDQTNSDED